MSGADGKPPRGSIYDWLVFILMVSVVAVTYGVIEALEGRPANVWAWPLGLGVGGIAICWGIARG